MSYRVAELIVDSLDAHGVDRAYSVPGESFLALLDALHARAGFDLVTCRHEGSAALAAIADAKLTGRPGVVLASRGPGAFNAAIGVHVAAEEAIPLVLLIGQVDAPNLGRGAVQEIDSSKAFSGLLKWSGRIESADRASEVLARAFAAATSGAPGPVAIELPEDVLTHLMEQRRPQVNGTPSPVASAIDVDAVFKMLSTAERPLLIVGGECRSDAFRAELQKLVEQWGIPVALTNKNQDQFPNAHPLWVGQLSFFTSPAHASLFSESDLIVAVGSRMGDVSSLGFSYPRQDQDRQRFVHVYPDAGFIGRHFHTDLPIVSSAESFVSAALAHGGRGSVSAQWGERVLDTARAAHGWPTTNVPENDVLGHAIMAVAFHAQEDAILTTDSGNFAGWVHRIFKMTPANRLLGSACGAMGTGVPAGVAAGLRYPGRQVIAFCGDGGFLMNGNELITAVERGINLVIVVSNNGSYGTIRLHQQRHFPGRVSGTDLANPNFAALAEAFGARGIRVRTAQEAQALVANAMSTPGPVLIEVCSDPDVTAESSMRNR
ncbi:thiamine pyrophosphate-dependent enzyme [Variovorax sp. LT1R16]|uniref:thiamine pyrophosphate-dependent enzyme n=1 Tax=Variovorax sp. LT1R16 TaxID=3443728 RepID=UPI003F481E9B